MRDTSKNIVQLFLDASRQYPDHIAIIEKNQSITYRQLRSDVEHTAASFLEQGLRPGDRVLVFVGMSIDLYRMVLALFYMGATAVFLDEWVKGKRMAVCCHLVNCKAYITKGKIGLLTFFSKPLRKLQVKLKDGQSQKVRPPYHAAPEETALITFTTGSTGIPKAADRTHRFLRAQFDALEMEIHPSPTDIDMPMLPIVLFLNLGLGATSIIAEFNARKPKKFQPKVILDQLKKHKANRLIGSPYFILELSRWLQKNHSPAPPSLKKIYTGGAPVFPSQSRNLELGFPQAEISIVYGSTEAEPISRVLTGDQHPEISHGLHAGNVAPMTECLILPINKKLTPVNTSEELKTQAREEGEIGEIVVTGNHVLKGYINNKEAERASKIRMGSRVWHRTGDSGFIRNQELFLTGRVGQLIETANGFISPFVVEGSLLEIDGVSGGTLLESKQRLVLVVESTLSVVELRRKTTHLKYDELHVFPSLPRDLRHHGKYDMKKLQLLIPNRSPS